MRYADCYFISFYLTVTPVISMKKNNNNKNNEY